MPIVYLMRFMYALILISVCSMAAASPPDLKGGYRDDRGNLLVTYSKKDSLNSDSLGLMYCQPSNCAELVSSYGHYLNGDTALTYRYNEEEDEAELRFNPSTGVSSLKCSLSSKPIDVRPISAADLNKLATSLRNAKIPIVAAPEVWKSEFLAKKQNGEIVYLESGPKGDRLFVGMPGSMKELSVKTYSNRNGCGFAGCGGLFTVGGFFGMGGKMLNTRGDGALGNEELKKVDLKAFDLASLKISGIPSPKDYNSINTCSSHVSSPQPANQTTPSPNTPAAK